MEFIYFKIFISTLKHKYKIGGNQMNKDEILKRNINDCKNNDEYKRSVEKRASELAIYAITSLALLFGFFQYFGVDGTFSFISSRIKRVLFLCL